MKLFDKIRITKPKLNKFDLSHERKMSLDMGKLVPILCQDIVPGDRVRMTAEILLRMTPMLAPIMHRVNVYTHFFFVPNRLVWSEWEDFITGGRLGFETPIAPYLQVNEDNKDKFVKGSLADYFGIPTILPTQTVNQPIDISALPFRAYATIFNEYYRDQNLSAPLAITKSSGAVIDPEYSILTTLRSRCWEKDYFTSALPWPQRGEEVVLPTDIQYKTPATWRTALGVLQPGNIGTEKTGGGAGTADNGFLTAGNPADTDREVAIENIDNIGTTINDFRRAMSLQKWLEKNARAGSRYVEQILSHFGVRSSDARLQRPEYLGGGRNPVVISEVLSTYQNADAADQYPQGNMSGHGISVGMNNGFKRTFEEHGYIIGIMSVLPKTAYQQGVPRHFRRTDKFDYFWPEFANIGEQEVKAAELFWDFEENDVLNDSTFGYQSRYAEYKYAPSTVHGDFRDSLSYWHMGRIFNNAPPLNENFVQADPTNRIYAVTDGDVQKIYCQIYNKVDALRPMPYFGTPSI